MTLSRFLILSALIVAVALFIYVTTTPGNDRVALVGVVSGHEVIVSAKIPGRLERLLVDEGSEVREGGLVAELDRAELEAQLTSAEANIKSLEARIRQVRNTWTWTDDQTEAAARGAAAMLTAARAQLEEARAELWRTELDTKRTVELFESGVSSEQDRDRGAAALRAAQARVKALEDHVKAREADLAVAQSNRKQLDVQASELASTMAQFEQARAARAEIEARLAHTRIFAPLSGIVSVRAARQGEVVQPGQPIVTVVDIDRLWVRAVVEESYVDAIHFGDRLQVRLPSGLELEGEVFFKGVESDFATQRDVSRMKRDIKAFAIKVSIPNPDRRLFLGMTAEVLLPPGVEKKGWFARWRESVR